MLLIPAVTFNFFFGGFMQWLSAVEFALLKGRHPLIKDVDITINPSKSLAFIEPQPDNKKVPKDNNFHEQSQLIFYNNVPHGTNGLLTGSPNENAGTENSGSGLLEDNGYMDRVSKDSDEEESQEESEESSEDDERGHVLQSANLVMNMLDATMPGTLDDDHKKKVDKTYQIFSGVVELSMHRNISFTKL
jgi:hypothetical protein